MTDQANTSAVLQGGGHSLNLTAFQFQQEGNTPHFAQLLGKQFCHGLQLNNSHQFNSQSQQQVEGTSRLESEIGVVQQEVRQVNEGRSLDQDLSATPFEDIEPVPWNEIKKHFCVNDIPHAHFQQELQHQQQHHERQQQQNVQHASIPFQNNIEPSPPNQFDTTTLSSQFKTGFLNPTPPPTPPPPAKPSTYVSDASCVSSRSEQRDQDSRIPRFLRSTKTLKDKSNSTTSKFSSFMVSYSSNKSRSNSSSSSSSSNISISIKNNNNSNKDHHPPPLTPLPQTPPPQDPSSPCA